MGIASDLADIKEVSDTIVANKVSKFCYTDTAYEDNDANGVNAYDINNEQNIPVGTPAVMKVNETVVTKGWRARASSITRMFMNHMLGRLSYNVNKLTDMMSSLLTSFSASLGTANGIATMNSAGKLSALPDVVNSGDSNIPVQNGTSKFTSGGAYKFFGGITESDSWLNRVFAWAIGRLWKETKGAPITPSEVLYANGLWVAGSNSVNYGTNGFYWSNDGKYWVKGTLNSETINTVGVYAITYNNGLWVAGVSSAGVWWSVDGKVWTQGEGITTPNFSVVPKGICYGNGIWVVVGGVGGGHVYTSTDGKNWTESVLSAPINYFDCVHYADGLFIASGTGAQSSAIGLFWSEDGVTWTKGNGTDVSGIQGFYCVSYANGIWVAGSRMNYEAVGQGLFWSEDGKNWTQGTGGNTGYGFNRVFYGNGLWVAGVSSVANSSSLVWWSEDGKSWTSGTLVDFQADQGQSSFSLQAIHYADGLWLISSPYSGSNPKCQIPWYSFDGKNWHEGEAVSTPTVYTMSIRCLYKANNLWLSGADNTYWSDWFVAFED